MAQAPSYDEIRTRKAENQAMQQQAGQQQAMRQDLDGQANAGKNAVLQDYMSRQMQANAPLPQRGLGEIDPAPYSRQMAQAQVDPAEERSKMMYDAVLNGEIDPMQFLDDESVLPQYKSEVANMMSQPGLGQTRQ